MGLWDRQIEDLHALGVRFSDLELRTLEEPPEGTAVLHLHPLWDPRAPEGQIVFMEDEEGNDIWRPEIIQVSSPFDLVQTYHAGKAQSRFLYEAMEDDYGVMSGAYPFYFGTVDAVGDMFDWNIEVCRRTEEPHPYPFWTCIPLGSEMELEAARALVSASEQRLSNSLYSDLTYLCEVEERSEFCISVEDLWLEKNDPAYDHGAGRQDPQALRYEQECWEEFEDPEAEKAALIESYQHLLDAGVIADPRISWEEHRRLGTEIRAYEFEPITNFLREGDFIAEQLHRSVTSRMRFVQARMTKLKGRAEQHVMQGWEGNLV